MKYAVLKVKILKNNNWIIANHSASHYPVSEDSYIDHFSDEYIKCDRFIEEYLEINNSIIYFFNYNDTYLSHKVFI